MNDLKGIIEDCNKSDLVSDKIIKKIIEIIGQEEWQDLHDENNDVCTTMGELIITLKGIADLEKENAELKNERNAFKIYSDGAELDAINLSEQLTKAKEIIKKIEKIFYSGENAIKRLSEISDILAEAEQFISEEK